MGQSVLDNELVKSQRPLFLQTLNSKSSFFLFYARRCRYFTDCYNKANTAKCVCESRC